MSNPEINEPKKARPSFFRRMLSAITHNWGWKLGCLIFAIALWSGLIMQDGTLLRSKVFTDVTISVLNEETMMRNGYIVVSGLDTNELSGVRLRADVPQRVYDTVQASNFNARVDLSRVRGTGRQTLQVLTTSTSTYGTVTDLSVSAIEVEVEEYVTRSRIPVRIAATGKLPDGLYAAAATADPIYVEIAGPKSLVDNVARCVVPYDMSELAYYVGTERTAMPFRLEDRQENEIPQDHISVSPLNSGIQIDTITVEQTIYELISLPVDVDSLFTGEPADGYRLVSVDVDPSQVRVAFSETSDAADIVSLHAASPASIDGLTESQAFTVSLLRPTDAKYMSVSSVTVTAEIRSEDELRRAPTPSPESDDHQADGEAAPEEPAVTPTPELSPAPTAEAAE